MSGPENDGAAPAGTGGPGAWLAAVPGRLAAFALAYATIGERRYEARVIEAALKIQVAFLALLAVVAPFGGFGLDATIGLGLLLQGAATWVVLICAWRRRLGLARWLYLGLAALTFVEAMRNTGIVGGIFGLEAMLSLIATWYVFALHRRTRPPRPEPEAEPDA